MPNREIKSYHASAERARPPLHNYRSLYVSCLSGGSSSRALQVQHQLSSPLGHYTKNHHSVSRVGNASNISGPPNGYRKVESGSASSTMWSRNISNDEPGMLGYPISNSSQQSERGFVFKNDEETNVVQEVKSLLAQNVENSDNALCISRRDFSSINPVSTFSSETSRSIASHVHPQGSNLKKCIDEGERSSMSFPVCRQEKVDYLRSMQALRKNFRDTDLTILERGECNHQYDSTVLLVGKEKLDIRSTSTKYMMPMSRKNDYFSLMPNIQRPPSGPLEEIQLSGEQSSHAHKDMIFVRLPYTDALSSAGKGIRRKHVIPDIPDLNIALSDLPNAKDMMGNSDRSTTSTKCLETTSLHAVQPSSTNKRIKHCKTSASGSISYGTKSLNLGDSYPREIVREGGLNKSELTFSGKEVIVLDSDDDANDGPASLTTSSISFRTKSLNKSELTFAGKEVIVLDD